MQHVAVTVFCFVVKVKVAVCAVVYAQHKVCVRHCIFCYSCVHVNSSLLLTYIHSIASLVRFVKRFLQKKGNKMVDISGKTCYNISTLPMGEGSGIGWIPLGWKLGHHARPRPLSLSGHPRG